MLAVGISSAGEGNLDVEPAQLVSKVSAVIAPVGAQAARTFLGRPWSRGTYANSITFSSTVASETLAAVARNARGKSITFSQHMGSGPLLLLLLETPMIGRRGAKSPGRSWHVVPERAPIEFC